MDLFEPICDCFDDWLSDDSDDEGGNSENPCGYCKPGEDEPSNLEKEKRLH